MCVLVINNHFVLVRQDAKPAVQESGVLLAVPALYGVTFDPDKVRQIQEYIRRRTPGIRFHLQTTG
jgi:hypothetical protein